MTEGDDTNMEGLGGLAGDEKGDNLGIGGAV